MRWEGLFADLEGQLAAEQRRERDDEVAERTRRERALMPLAAVVTLRSLGPESSPARAARRFGLGYALRALSRDRATVVISLVGDGPRLLGTIDGVGADHLDLAEHPDGLPRRRENVRAMATVPFAALIAVESRR